MRITLFVLAFLVSANPCLASETETAWNGATGDWATVVNWSAGEPALDCPASIPAGFVSITQPGEECASLHVGSEPGVQANLQITNGGLTVAGRLTMSGGIVAQYLGEVALGRLQVAEGRSGSYAMNGGTLTVEDCTVGVPGRSGTFNMVGGTVTIQDSTVINRLSSMTVSGLSANADLGKVLMKGIFALVNGPRPILADSFIMEGDSRLQVTLGSGSLSVIEVEGDATLNGLLKILEAQTVAAGTYEVLRAGSLSGSFATTDAPGSAWTWFVENNALFLRKGDDSPVESTSWSRLKTADR